MVSRRDVLSTVAGSALVASAGCLGFGSSVRTPTIEVAVDDLWNELEPLIDFDVEVVRGFTAERPARIRATLTTRETDRSVNHPMTIRLGATPPFSSYLGLNDDGHEIPILPEQTDHVSSMRGRTPEAWVPDEPDGECWRVPVLPRPRAEPKQPTTLRLPPNVTISNEYVVLGYATECFGEGAYRFSSGEPYHITIDGQQRFRSESNTVLGFSLTFD